DLLLAGGLAAFALANLAFDAVPTLGGGVRSPFAGSTLLLARLLIAGLLVAAAVAPARMLPRRGVAVWKGATLLAFSLGVPAAVVGLAGNRAPTASASLVSPASLTSSALEVATIILFLVASVGFAVKGARGSTAWVASLAPAAALCAFVLVDGRALPSLSTGEILVGAFSIAVLVGAARALAACERDRVRAAVLEERRRVARDLHDGLAHELAFLVTQAQLVARVQPGTAGLGDLEATAQRALDEARLAIAAMTRKTDETLDAAVAAVAEEIAQRAGVTVRLELDRGIDASAEVREAMVRIVREAVANAIRHGGAKELRVVLSQAEGIRLEVIDDGRGFDPVRVSTGGRGFGLVSMSERARALGGAFRVTSQPGAGTRIEVEVA
ncbi:MAG: sensor histidine kinase, partial [Actinomycetota bacterium]|nr:sensor histidine kinase [Actinomycetota bacterium]